MSPAKPSGKPVPVRRRSLRRAAGISAVIAVAMPGAHSLAVVTEGDGAPPPPPDSTYAAADAGSLGLPPPPPAEAKAPPPDRSVPPATEPPPPPPSPVEEVPAPAPDVQTDPAEALAPPPEPPAQEAAPPPPPDPEPPTTESEPAPPPTEPERSADASPKISAADAADAGALGLIEDQPELVQEEPVAPEPTAAEQGEENATAGAPASERSAAPPVDPIPDETEAIVEDNTVVAAGDPEVVAPAPEEVLEEPTQEEPISGQSAADAGSLGVVEEQPKLVNPDAATTNPPVARAADRSMEPATGDDGGMDASGGDASTGAEAPPVTVELKTPSAFAADVAAAPVVPGGSTTTRDAGSDAFTIGLGDVTGGEEPPAADDAGVDPFTLGIDDLRPAAIEGATGDGAGERSRTVEPTDGMERRAVAEGDNLWTIAAEALGDDAGVPEIASYVDEIVETNDAIGDPNMISAGIDIDLPETHQPYVPVADNSSNEQPAQVDVETTQEEAPTGRGDVLIPEFGPPEFDEPVVEFGPPDLEGAVEIVENRLADSDNPQALGVINPETGRVFTEKEIEDAIRRAEARRAGPYAAIDDHARAARASEETGSIVEPIRPLNLEERIVAVEDQIFNAEADPDDLHLVNPATGDEFTDADLIEAEENAIARRVEARSAEFTLDEKVEITRSLGFDVPDELSPGDIAGIDELLGLLPDDLIGPLVNEGMTVSFDAPIPGAATPRFGILPGGADVGVTRSVEVELSGVQLDTGFEETQTFEISVTAGVEGHVGAGGRTTAGKIRKWYERVASRTRLPGSPELPGFSGGYRGAFDYTREIGTELSYEATVGTDQGDRLADGDMSVLPDILEPLEMTEGNSLLIRGSTVDTTTIGARYRVIYGEGTSTRLEGMGFGVERIDGDRVVIVAGPISEVEDQLFLGLKKFGAEGGVEFGTTRSLSDMSFAELDLSTPAGQEAYQRFLLSGAVPLSTDEGIERSGETLSISSEADIGAVFRAGPIDVGISLLDADEQVDITTNPDGSRDLRYVEHHYGKTTEANQVVTADGVVDQGASTYEFVVPDVNPNTAGFNDQIFTGEEGAFAGEVDVQVSFTGEELMELSAMAERRVREMADLSHDPDEVYELFTSSPVGLVQNLAAAEDPYEVFILLRGQTGGGLMEYLPTIGLRQDPNPDEPFETLPGQIAFND